VQALDDVPLHNWIATRLADALPSMDAACLPQVVPAANENYCTLKHY